MTRNFIAIKILSLALLTMAALAFTSSDSHAKQTFKIPKKAPVQLGTTNGDYITTNDAKNFATANRKKRLSPREQRKQQHRQHKTQRTDNKPTTNE